jgi:N-acetylneuraminate synthase
MERCTIIAEVGVNHNGSLDLALELVDAAARAGADIVKFQTFRAELITAKAAPKAEYQKAAAGDAAESQQDMLRRLELSEADHVRLLDRCRAKGIGFLSTPFDLPSLHLLTGRLGLTVLKLPSGEITNAPLLLAAARSGCDVILSTGMSTLDDVAEALGVLAFGYLDPRAVPSRRAFSAAIGSAEGRAALAGRVTLLHCTTEYPAPFGSVNLRAMASLSGAFGLPVGLSDHTPGISVATAAVALGARVVEKHLTLDRGLPGPDHAASLVPDELALLVRSVREVEASLGDGIKRAAQCELGNRAVARKSLVAARAIRAGELFDGDNLAVKRPGTGVSPMDYWDWLGRAAGRDYAADEVIA